MGHGDHQGELGEVYTAASPQQVAEIYDRWSATYDDYMETVGYRHPAICVALLARHVPAGDAPMLDAGVGTGLTGEMMRLIGYDRIDGIDISTGMLDRARGKDVYAGLHLADMTKPLDLPRDHYRAVISCGVFTTGHVGSEGLVPLLAVCRPGGHIVTTVKTGGLWEDDVRPALQTLEAEGTVRLIESTPPYASMPGDKGTISSVAVVVQKQV
jgi:predicted TPR repeat methyltransferase